MLKFVSTTILISLVLFSCSKDNESNTNFPLKNFFILNMNNKVKTLYYRDYKYFFKYNTNGLVTKIHYISANDTSIYMELFYDQYDRLINSNEYIGSECYKCSYEYLKDQVIINEKAINSTDGLQVKRILFYNSSGECIRSEIWPYDSNLGKPVFTGNYTLYAWKDNNVASCTAYYNNYLSNTLTFEYDTLLNPIRGLNNCLIPDLAYDTYLSKNMIKSRGNLDNNYVTKYRYEYKQDSFLNRYWYSNSNSTLFSDLYIEFE